MRRQQATRQQSQRQDSRYRLTGLKPGCALSTVRDARARWMDVSRPLLLAEARLVTGADRRRERESFIHHIDTAFFELLTERQRSQRHAC